LSETTTTPPSLEQRIADAVDNTTEPSEHNILPLLARDLDEETTRALAEEALLQKVRRYLRGLNARSSGGSTTLGVPRSTRWDIVSRSAADGTLDLARVEVDTGTGTKPLLDCMYADLSDASENHLRFAMANEAFAAQYRRLADLLLESDDARTVRDLPEEIVRRLFSA
jgi:hypothetical protein